METSVPSTFSLDSRTQRCKALSRASFFPCLIPQQACDSEVQRLGENEADSRRVEALSESSLVLPSTSCCLEERRQANSHLACPSSRSKSGRAWPWRASAQASTPAMV